jgi:putative ABC transport system permease protein
MYWLAPRMLIAHRTRYLAMLFGLTFASLLICQQLSIFCGVLRMWSGEIRDLQDAPIWVLSAQTQYVDDLAPLAQDRVEDVRGVPGMAWAVPLQTGYTEAHLDDGRFQLVMLLGLDDATLVGAPSTLLIGDLAGLQRPEAIIIDEVGHRRLWPGSHLRTGWEVTMNGRRAVVVGVCRATPTFQTLPVFYTRRSQAVYYLPAQSQTVSAILVREREGEAPEDVCRRIAARTGLLALTREQWIRRTVEHYLRQTGLLLNFATTVLLRFMVGVAISGQSFSVFTIENLPQFGMLKAMGASGGRLVAMLLLQTTVISGTGFGLGVGLAAAYGEATRGHSKLVFYMPWQVLVLTGAAILFVSLLSSALSIRRVLRVDPGIIAR